MMAAMSIESIGLATPLGRDPARILDAVLADNPPLTSPLRNPFGEHSFPTVRVDPSIVDDVARLPRLRRAGAISHFAVAAGLDAMKRAGREPGDDRLALVFATTNGGVVHTRRFFEDIAAASTQSGSPILFPETVYNAPASHIAAALGITGTVTTLVNDSTAGLDAIAAAAELLASDACDRCLVVAAEEADWVVCEACATWGLADPASAPFGEGAAALLMSRDGPGISVSPALEVTAFRSLGEAAANFARITPCSFDLVASSASGRRFDAAEDFALPGCRKIELKRVLGEAFAASALMQVALATQMIEEGQSALATTGFHGQQGAVRLERRGL